MFFIWFEERCYQWLNCRNKGDISDMHSKTMHCIITTSGVVSGISLLWDNKQRGYQREQCLGYGPNGLNNCLTSTYSPLFTNVWFTYGYRCILGIFGVGFPVPETPSSIDILSTFVIYHAFLIPRTLNTCILPGRGCVTSAPNMEFQAPAIRRCLLSHCTAVHERIFPFPIRVPNLRLLNDTRCRDRTRPT